MATPGATYDHLVRSTAGATPSAPCPAYCTRQDAKDWHASSNAVAAAVEYQLGQIATIASERGQVLDPALEIDAGQYFADIDSNEVPPERSLPAEFRATIDRSIGSLRRATVLLERLDAASLRLGVPSPTIPGFPKKAPSKSLELVPTAIGVLLVAAVGVAVYYTSRRPTQTQAPALEPAEEI